MDTPRSGKISPRLRQIAKLAREAPQTAITTLAHHIDTTFLREAYRLTRKDGAVGVDGQTQREYSVALEANLQSLLDRFKSGTYRAPPVRRVEIPKGDGRKTRPIGIPTFEDKVLQRAVTMVLEAVYEQDFLDCSYGFRPGRGAHQMLEALWTRLTRMGGGWVLDVDVKGFFDNLDHGHLRTFLDQRVRDGVLRRAIGKWLKAGVMDSGQILRTELGTPQGGVISPLLANVYLHEVLDKWFEQEIKPRLHGEAFMVRYADDFVIVCETEYEARRILGVLPERLGRFGLTMHPEKTRLVNFKRPPPPGRPGGPKRGTFNLLGFTHYWGQSRRGRWAVKRKTARDRFNRALKRCAQWCRQHRHLPVAEQHRKLCRSIRGHDAYYGITGNGRALAELRDKVRAIWRKWLNRRSQNNRMSWPKFQRLKRRYPLPPPRVVQSVYGRQQQLPMCHA